MKLTKEDIANCRFVPLSSLQRAVEVVQNPYQLPDERCKRNLLRLQIDRSLSFADTRQNKWRTRYEVAVNKAIYSHDWNKLLYLLKSSSICEHASRMHKPFYIRALTILLMNHPNARSQGLLNDFLHMVLACRSDGDKKALLKLMLSLPNKLYSLKVEEELDRD